MIGVIEARATVNLVVAEDGVPTIAEVEAEVEVDPSVVALRVPFMFLGGMQLVIVLAAALSGCGRKYGKDRKRGMQSW